MAARRKRLIAGAFLGIAATSLIVWAGAYAWRADPNTPVLPSEISREEFERAGLAWQARHGRPPTREDVLVSLGDAYFREERLQEAVACYAQIPTEHRLYGLGSRLEQAKVLIRLHRARPAEENLREFIDHIGEESVVGDQQVVEALDLLRFLLEVELRFEERVDILRVTHEIGAASTFETLAYCFPTALRWNGPQTAQWLEGFWKEDPTDFTLRVALGRYRTGAGRLEEAQGVLETCCRERPESLPAQAALLACYYEQNDWERIERTMRQLPPRAATEPWLLVRMRGQYHNHRGEFAEAIKCFQQMLAADPVNAESWKGLARAYEALQREQERHDALRRMQLSARLQSRLGAVLSKEDDVAPLLEAIELCKEAKLWSQARLVANAARRIDPDHVDVKKALENLPDEQ